jgi:hypothetical protein
LEFDVGEPRFTPRTARRALARIRPVAERGLALYRRLESMRPEPLAGDQLVHRSYFVLVVCLRASISVLRQHGVRTENLRQGWIDFPARRAGRDVLLSWKVGEPTLAHWREGQDGPARRRRLDEDGPWEGETGSMLDCR